ncbi:hypothetical protein [Wolbachia endosymbiont of Folsomia candida]|uniref:hypothetical protein n=1 Tax=Wolbachia endosymbiont of Folsomia candida TaxID=169402 RepID=UPI000ADBCF47|nr:hypothetical protein [Wolbachia endosymbiont of Folsomia candida]APR97803.1 hypothetical protein ASM33_00390 [Wolbachia endosymbiont of Folsomia candida]
MFTPIHNLADTFVDDITPAVYQYNQKQNKESYRALVSACKTCLSRYSKVISDIEEEYKHLNNQINIEQALDNILKRLSQITTVLDEFNEYQIGHSNKSFIPIALKLEKQIKLTEDQGSTKLTKHKKELESLKRIIAEGGVDVLIPQIHELNNKAKLLQSHIRNSGIHIPNEKVNATNMKNVASTNSVEEKPGTSKQVTFNEQEACSRGIY